jgi:chromosome segregation ATPase
LDAKCVEAEAELAEAQTQYSKVNQELNLKNESLVNQVATLKKHIEELEAREREQRSQELQKSLVVPEIKKVGRSKSKYLKLDLDEAKQAVKDLSQKLVVSEVKRQTAETELSRKESANAQLAAEIEKQKTELDFLQSANVESAKELQSLRASLQTNLESRGQDRKGVKKLKSKITDLTSLVQSHVQTIRDLTVEKENNDLIVERLRVKAESLKDELRQTKEQLEVVQSQLEVARRESQERPSFSPDDLIPIPAWRCHEFDQNLGKQIEKITANGFLQPASKLTQIYRVIHAHYSDEIKACEQKAKAAVDELQRVQGIVNQLVIDLSVTLSMGAATSDDLINRGWGSLAVQKVREQIQAVDDLKSVSHQLHALSQHILTQFGDSPDLLARISEVSATLAKQRETLKSKAAKNRTLRARLYELRDTRAREVDRLTAENHALNGTIEQLNAATTASAESTKKLKSELSAANRARQEAEASLAQLESALRADQSRVIDNLNKDHEVVQQQLRNHIAQLRAELDKASETISNQDLSIKKLKKLTDSRETGISDTSAQIDLLRNAHQDTAETRSEREQLIET